MGSSKRIASGIAWTTILNIVNSVYGFISVPILIAYFGKSDYGLIGLAMSVNIYLRLLDLGFNSTNIRFFSNWLAKGQYGKVNKLFQSSLSFYGMIGILNAIILLLVSFFSKSIFNITPEQDVIVKHLFYILSISAFISWYTSCFDQFIRANERVGWVQKMMLLPKIAQIIILILTVTLSFSIEWYYGLTAFSLFLIIPFMIRKIHRISPYISFCPSFNWGVFKQVLPYSLNIFSFGLFQFSIVNLRPVFLGMKCSAESITDYNILNGIVTVVTMFGGAFMGVFLPSASKVVANNDDKAQERIVYQGTKYISIAICFCCFGMMTISPEMLTVYVGTDYLYLLCWLDLWLLATLVTHNQAISSLILAGADVRAITYITIISSIIGIIVMWFLIPIYNVGGTVIGYLVYCFMQIFFYYLYYWPKVMKINSTTVFVKSFLPYAFIGLFLCISLRSYHITELGVWYMFFIKGAIFSLLFAIFSYYTLNQQEREFVIELLKK